MYDLNLRPEVVAKVSVKEGCLNIKNDSFECDIPDLGSDCEYVEKLLSDLDGSKTLSDIFKLNPEISSESVQAILTGLEREGLVRCIDEPECMSGLECLLKLEDLQNKLMYETLYQNIFWMKSQEPDSVPINVFYGMAIENYHFLFRESWFDSSILCFAKSIGARVLMNEFYCEEYGHDELILKSLNNIGITREDIYKTVPLPQTMSLCNSLAYWAANDPLFFFSTIGVLEGKDLKIDSYVSAMEESGKIDSSFIKYIKDHSNINLEDEHGNLSREIYRRIPYVSKEDYERLRRQTHLFIEIYDNFYTAIWEYYSKAENILRVLDENGGVKSWT